MDQLTSTWSRIAWAQCWQVTLLIVGVWLVLRVVGGNRPHLACALWLVVLLKCITPPLVSSPSGIFCWLQRTEPAAEGQSVLAATNLELELAVSPEDDAIVVQASPVVAAAPIPAVALPIDRPAAGEIAAEPASQAIWSWSLVVSLAAFGWLLGVLVFGAVATAQWLACWRKLTRAGRMDEGPLAELVDDLRRRLALRRSVRLLVTESSLGPAVVGLWRPTIILPAVIVREKSPAELAPLVAHELIHVRRGDLWIGLLQTLAVGLWWFHPLVRLASRLITREAERCCDEETIAHLGCEPAAYARSLLDVLALKQELTPIPAFPGVRPVDVTLKRLERIMKLGQGCHKRTPWWCWLIMLAAAAAVLPGAALVVGAKEKPKPRPRDPKQYIRPDFPLADGELDGKPAVLVTRTYEVADLVAALAKESGDPESAVRQLLTTLVQMAAPGPWEKDGDSPGRYTGWEEGKLLVRQTDDGHQRIAEQLAALREHGYAQIAVEVRIVFGPAAVLDTQGVDWRMIGGSEPEEGSLIVANHATQVRAASVVERHVPAMLALVDEERASKLLAEAQSGAKPGEIRLIQAPKVTLFNGQSARVEDSVQRPFVVGVTPTADGNSTALKPTIRVFSEGTSIRLRPIAQKDGLIRLDFGLTLSQIRDVETAEFPTGPGKEPITVQVPEVASTRLTTTVEMNAEQTLVLAIPKTGKGKKEQQPMAVMVKVRRIEHGLEDRASKPTPEATRPAAESSNAAHPPRRTLALDTSGWRLTFSNKEGGTLDVLQSGGNVPPADLHIQGGARFEAVAEKQGDNEPERIVADADGAYFTSRTAAANATARLEVTLVGNVRLTHNDSRIEAQRVRLQIDDPFVATMQPGRMPASMRIQLDEVRTMASTPPPFPKRQAPQPDDFGLVEKVYPVADLVIPIPLTPLTISGDGRLVDRGQAKLDRLDFEKLIEVIKMNVEPKSWSGAGQDFRITPVEKSLSLSIRQTAAAHHKIAALLDELRSLQDQQVSLAILELRMDRKSLERLAKEAGEKFQPLLSDREGQLLDLSAEEWELVRKIAEPSIDANRPKITLWSGQGVNLEIPAGGKSSRELLASLELQPFVMADFRYLRLLALVRFGGDDSGLMSGQSLDIPRGHCLLVDLSAAPWLNKLDGTPIIGNSPYPSQIFHAGSPQKPDERRFYLITPKVFVAAEQEAAPSRQVE